MSFTVPCPQCQTPLALKDEHRGKQIRCPKCQNVFQVPAAGAPAPAPAAPPAPKPAPAAPAAPQQAPGKPEKKSDGPFNLKQLAAEHPWLTEHLGESGNPFSVYKPTESRKSLRDLPLAPLPEECPDEANVLGKPLATLPVRIFPFWGWVLALMVILPCTCSGVGATTYIVSMIAEFMVPGAQMPAAAVGFLLTAGAVGTVGYFLLHRLLRRTTLWFCQHGLVWQRGEEVGWCRWEEIEQFYFSAVVFLERTMAGVQGREAYTFEFRVPGGRKFVLASGPLGDARVFGERLEQKLTATMLPLYLERLNRGEAVECRPFSFTRDELTWNKKRIPWSEVEEVTLINGWIGIHTSGNKQWGGVTYSGVSQARTFLLLAEYLVKFQQERR